MSARAEINGGCRRNLFPPTPEIPVFRTAQSEAGPFEREHPLLNNDVVMNIVFEYLNTRDLKVCRLVSKKWNFRTIPFTQSKFEVNIDGPEEEKSWKRFVQPRPTGLRNFVELIESNTLGLPFAKYKLGPLDKYKMGPFDDAHAKIVTFLKICGKTAKEFDLCKMSTRAVHTVEHISALLKSAPKLESFIMPNHITTSSDKAVELFPGSENEKPKFPFLKKWALGFFDNPQRQNACPTFLEELILAAENLSTFILWGTFGSLEVLNILEKLGRESTVDGLSIYLSSVRHMELLRKMAHKGLKLKKLEVRGREEDWLELVDSFKDSLTSLLVDSTCSDMTKFPAMPNLKMLKFGIDDCTCMKFLNTKFPALQSVHLTCFDKARRFDEFLIGTGTTTVSCRTIKYLDVQSVEMRIEALQRTLSFFPALKELQIQVREVDVLKKIWTLVTGLEFFTIYGTLATGGNIDTIFTGLPVGEMKRIKKYYDSMKKLTVDARDIILNIICDRRKQPSIANLTNLRSLTICVTATKKPASGKGQYHYLSDLTGYLGLHSMKNLKELYISKCDFSKSCCEMLVTDMELEDWNFLGATEVEIIQSRNVSRISPFSGNRIV